MKMASAAAAMAALMIFAGCTQRPGLYKDTRVIMGTYVTVTVSEEDIGPQKAVDAANAAFDEISRVDRLMSTYKPESQLSEVNRQAGIKPVKVDPELLDTVQDALDAAAATGGAFDPTVGPLVRAWKIGPEGGRIPATEEIEKARALVGYSQVAVDKSGGTVFIKKKGMSIDLGGIAKGYSADRAVEAMKARGARGGIVAVAGDLKLFGRKPGGGPWKVGIQHPREKDAMLASFNLTDAATSTSGDYERFFIKDGVRYHHIIDPKTGYPAKGLVSVTVLAHDSYVADSLSTGIFVMGPEKGRELAGRRRDIEVLMIDKDGKVFATGRFIKLGVKSPNLGQANPE
ncbi:MAG TPA: FAD:protein FMN transferase [Nitrospirota bacterium]